MAVGESTNSYRKRVYGVDDDWVETQLIVQGGVCAICRRVNPPRKNGGEEPLSIDHDHFSGRTRSLLCTNCNLILGRIEGKSGCQPEQSEDYLLRFIIYLREHANGAIPFSPVGQESSEILPAPGSVHLMNGGPNMDVTRPE